MSKHTPTPWRVADPNDFPWMLEAVSSNLEPTVTVVGAGGYGVISIPSSVTGSFTQAIADMRHAVRCVNSHDALLAVARDALAMAELNVPPEAARGIAERARAAIAAAEG